MGHQVITVLNLSNKAAELAFSSTKISGTYSELFTGKEVVLKNTSKIALGPWGYQVYYK
jgi:hypothetical protein